MPIQILMPSLSPTMETGTLSKWLKKEGEEIKSGDLIAEIETDKATMEIEAVDEGVLGKILVEEGTEDVPVNRPIAILAEEGDDMSAISLSPKSLPPPQNQSPKNILSSSKVDLPQNIGMISPVKNKSSSRILASPLAKRLAKQKNLDLNTIKGTGPGGRIIKIDIETQLANDTSGITSNRTELKGVSKHSAVQQFENEKQSELAYAPNYNSIPLTSMRKIISQRMISSTRDIPHFNLTVDVETDKLLETIKNLNLEVTDETRITLNDLILKAVALALHRNPKCNVCFTEEAILEFDQVDISFAVSIDGGLITPVIRNPVTKGLSLIAEESKALIKKAREGNLRPEEYQGGTFTISNLGMYGIKSFNSIINSPQSAILSVGSSEPRPIVKNDLIKIATVMSLTLAIDHRCIDGAPAAILLKEIKTIIENPVSLML